MKISAVVIAFNEELKIGRALRSVAWADEILVVDSGSADRTAAIAAAAGARVIVREWPGFAEQKQFAADSAAHDWIFSLDADEAVSEELSAELARLRAGPADTLADGYLIPRLSFYMGRPIRHGGWYPDRQLRLFDRRKGRWNGALVHESVKVEGSVGKLRGNILHYSVDGPAHHHRMIGERYAPLAAEQMFASGKRTSAPRVIVAGAAAFVRAYFLKLGILDGFPGFCVARFAAHHAFLKHLLLYQLQHGEARPGRPAD